MVTKADAIAKGIARGDRGAVAKAISVVENDQEAAKSLMRLLGAPGRAFVVGITGPPGTGKSTLVDRLIGAYREKGFKVAVVAVDPTSPITGGALLGDRVRMSEHSGDRAVFIRSMATRGWVGGLSAATSQAIRILDAAGYDLVFLETVGIGQSDIEVVGLSHAVVVVLMPGMGDEVQMSKAGLMEVGDVYVVNKSDLGGGDALIVSLLSMVRSSKTRSPAVLAVSALKGEGLDKLADALEKLRSKFEGGDREIKLRSVRGLVLDAAKGALMRRFSASSVLEADRLAAKVLEGKLTVEQAADKLVG
ncbi:MAG: methylmalonyl Co-A mutase-associated GTPase MeaB [Thaumarchaeota archaeon]|nr:methylmalonyl Co-A mutase-associated GTPase MeaB [Nitrososphaerota archaeon]